MLSDLLRHPLFLGAAAALFSWWLSKWWQTTQEQSKIRTALVSDMTSCVMSFDAPVRQAWEALGPARVPLQAEVKVTTSDAGPSGNTSESTAAEAGSSGKKPKNLDECRVQFDIQRWIIHAKLEAYFPTEPWIEHEWTELTKGLIWLSRQLEAAAPNGSFQAEKEWLQKMGEVNCLATCRANARWKALPCESGKERKDWVLAEELLLAEKIRLVHAVQRQPMQVWKRQWRPRRHPVRTQPPLAVNPHWDKYECVTPATRAQ